MSMEFQPIENVEAARALASKTAVGREVFDKLLPELRARAFVVSGLEDLRMVRAVRNAIEELPKGESWEKVSAQVREKLEEGGFSEKAAAQRAELLVRHHGFQAYAEADYAAKMEMKEDFPYWKYQTMGDGHVRASHAALDGLVLPADDPFWKDHYPPWEWGCRCQVVAIDADEYKEIVDAGRVAGNRKFDGSSEEQRAAGWTLGKTGMKQLHDAFTLDDGTGRPVLLNKPREETYHWHPGESSMRASDLHARYAKGEGAAAEQDWDGFYRQMEGVRIPDAQGRERPAWDWVIQGDVRAAAREALARSKEKGVEACTAVDYKTGERIGEMVEGTEDRVNIGPVLDAAKKKGCQVAIVHTHPMEGGIPSEEDVQTMLANSASVRRLDTMEWDGKTYHMMRPGAAWGAMDAEDRGVMQALLEIWSEELNYEEWGRELLKLDAKGVVEYEKNADF